MHASRSTCKCTYTCRWPMAIFFTFFVRLLRRYAIHRKWNKWSSAYCISDLVCTSQGCPGLPQTTSSSTIHSTKPTRSSMPRGLLATWSHPAHHPPTRPTVRGQQAAVQCSAQFQTRQAAGNSSQPRRSTWVGLPHPPASRCALGSITKSLVCGAGMSRIGFLCQDLE